MRVLLALLLVAPCSCTEVTPIQKVIQMMEDMMAKGKKEKEDEIARMDEYKTFCKDTAWEKTCAIKTAKSAIEELSADIDKAGADALVAAKEIAALNGDISAWEADKKKNAYMREKEHAVFVEIHKDYTESIDAVERALSTLKAGPGLSAASASLLQLGSMGAIPAEARKVIMSFLQKVEPVNALLQDAEAIEQPQAAVKNYESSSGTVIEMVEKLGEKFEDERAEVEKKEATAKHSYDMMQSELERQLSYGTEERDSKMAFKAKRESDKADATGELGDTQATLAEDEKFLADLTAECEQKAVDFEARQKLRQEELDAIQEAIDIMSSDTVAGSGDKHLPGLVQTGGRTALTQLRSSSQSPTQRAVYVFLNDRAQQTNSRVLSLLAVKVSADPFKKVVKMIKDMITKLVEEANEEAEHKGFCDSELGSNKQTRDSKTEESQILKATIEELTADISKLASEISELGNAISELDAAVSKATEMRATEKTKNTETIADAKAGKEAVQRAIAVLKTFYDKAGKATALVQRAPGAPETFDKPYTGMEGGGVMGMLEVCESDFARLESDTTTGEAEAQKVYDEFMADSTADKTAKETDVKKKTALKQEKESALAQAKKDLAGVQEELDAALAYYEKLKPSCVDAGESYEERVARRKNEIESLQEALKILNGESV